MRQKPTQHIIYALADPATHRVRYVGRTSQTAARRLGHHMSAAKRGHESPVYAWIRNLSPRVPLIIVLEELPNHRRAVGQGYERRYESTVEAAETKWMKRFERSEIFNCIKRDSHVYRRLVNR